MHPYNSAGQVLTMQYPANNANQAGELLRYSYRPQDSLDGFCQWAGIYCSYAYVSTSLYNAAGQLEYRGFGSNLLCTDYVYFPWNTVNGVGRLKRLLSGVPTSCGSLQDLRYYEGTNQTPTHDAVGNLLKIKNQSTGGQVQTFGYDSLNRLDWAYSSGG